MFYREVHIQENSLQKCVISVKSSSSTNFVHSVENCDLIEFKIFPKELMTPFPTPHGVRGLDLM